jgi:hypothetical protein
VAADDLGRAGVVVHHEQTGALHHLTILQSHPVRFDVRRYGLAVSLTSSVPQVKSVWTPSPS